MGTSQLPISEKYAARQKLLAAQRDGSPDAP